MKPERWCCICERYNLDTDEQVLANELVAQETCYLRAKKFFYSRNATSSENHPCEVVVAEFMFGSDLCGQPATRQINYDYGCMHWVCDEHVRAQK